MNTNTIDDVYIYSEETAYQNGELDLYYANRKLNIVCATAVDKAICDSNIGKNHCFYYMKFAVKTVIVEYGTERLLWVLANIIQYNDGESRFSQNNKNWAMTLAVPKDAPFCKFVVKTQSSILDNFICKTREICDILHNE